MLDLTKKKIGFISLGCDKNRVDLEKMIFKIKSAGLEIVNEPSCANIIIVNTCAFLESARREAIENILEMAPFKSVNLEKLIVTGCLNELKYPDLAQSLPEVDAFINVKDNDQIVQLIAKLYGVENFTFDIKDGRILTTASHYAFLKISEGCNNFCTYCLIPFIRGRYSSFDIEQLVTEAKQLALSGVKELLLVAQDVTKYGIDLYGKKSLVELIKRLSHISNIEWIRLMYCYPEEIDDDLIAEIRDNPKVVKYLDIPLQHVSDKILKQMNRRSSHKKIEELFEKIKLNIPNIVLRTTFILGFPGEDDCDIEILTNFLKKHRLQNVGFFKYSREVGTRSFDFDNQVSQKEKARRLKLVSSVQYRVMQEILASQIGQTYDVISDENQGNFAIGRYFGQAPMIDNVIKINENLPVGQLFKIKIINKKQYDLQGEKL